MHRFSGINQALVRFLLVLSLIVPALISPPAQRVDATMQVALPSLDAPGVGLFRTRVTVRDVSARARLEQLGVAVLEEGPGWALVLADADQLETLARLRFGPQATDDLDLLVKARGQVGSGWVTDLQPLLAQARAIQNLTTVSGEIYASARTTLHAAMRGLSNETQAAIASFAAIDDDADGLTNTQEQWWCTDPLNPDSDSDGVKDGDEVQAARDWLGNLRAGPPVSGKPFAGWPPQIPGCRDDDQDSVPDLAERWDLGLNMNRESTDRDKFDDGQELFGNTYCPGSGGYCGYGALPRNEDWGVIFAEMPSWVKAPGNHPLVAAFPVPEIDVMPSSLHVETVTTVTTDHTISQGTERSYSTSKTEGTSDSVANTVTWNEWEETSISVPQTRGLSLASSSAIQARSGSNSLWKFLTGSSKVVKALGTIGDVATGMELAWKAGKAIGHGINWMVYQGALLANGQPLDLDFSPDDFGIDNAQSQDGTNRCNPCSSKAAGSQPTGSQTYLNNQAGYAQTQDLPASASPHTPVVDESGRTRMQMAYPVYYPVPTVTTTRGQSHGGAQTNTHTEYEEHTITNGEAFSSGESWGTATAVDSSHAADLWFTYKVRNTGTEYAREIAGLAFNIYIGDDPNPAITYFVAPDLGGDGKLHNFMPNEEHTYTSRRIPLTLEQMKAVDLGGPVRIVVEDFTYGIDELFYEDAVNAGVLIAIEDGTDDGDEAIDTYLIPTWGTETVLDVLARYFPHTADADGNLIAIWTPEYRADTPAWCQEPRRVGTTLWCRHALSTADWWNVYTNGLGDGSEGFQDTPAAPGSVALFRFNKDSDLDGYSDRSEERLGTDPNDPGSHPRPELIAGVHSIRVGNQVTATLSLLNTGLYDAYGVEAVMIAPDDSVSIANNTVGGSGRVRAQRQVVVGSRILLQSPLPPQWTQSGHARPAVGGYYTGSADRTYTFTVQCANPGGCDVGAGDWSLAWNSGTITGTLNFGAGYASPTFLDVGSLGVKLALYSGKVYHGESFTVEARTPRDTFQYTINREPYTEPIVIVSYNDPQGNHRFVTPVRLSTPAENLGAYSGQMLPDPGVEIVTTEPFTVGVNTVSLVVNNPTDRTLTDAHLFLEFINITGTVVSEVPVTVTLPAGPTVVPVTWDTTDFDPPYDPAQDYIVMAFWTDYQGNILGTAARPLSSFQEDPRPAFAMREADEMWDFGTVARGTLLRRTIALSSVGFMDLLTYIPSAPGLSISGVGSRRLSPGDVAFYDLTLNTADLPEGPFERTLTIRTSDPDHPTRTLTVRGTITAYAPDTAPGALQRPLDWSATFASGTQGQWVQFTHTLGPDPQTLHPVKVYSQDYSTLWGVGKYATPFGQGTFPYDMFGTGQDGDLIVNSGQVNYPNKYTSVVGSVSAGQNAVPVASTSAFNINDEVLIIQTQGPYAGRYEFNRVQSKSSDSLILQRPLENAYEGFTYISSACGDSAAGLRGEYFNNRTWSGSPTFVRCDPIISFDWREGSPGGGLPSDNFSIRWSGQIAVPRSGNYSFSIVADDMARLYLDGNLIFAGGGSNTVTTFISNGRHTIVIEYYEEGGGASIRIIPPLANLKAQVVRVPNFRNVNIQSGGTVRAPEWNYNVGGIIIFRSNGTVTINGSISNNGGNGATATIGNPLGGSGGGFHGGQGDAVNNDNYGRGTQGEGTAGIGGWSSDPNGNGGGAGPGSPQTGNFGTGGGGGNGEAGSPSTAGGIGQGGMAAGNAELTSIVLGGGGGGSNDNPGNSIGGGGAGGGIIIIIGKQISIYGPVTANGGQGGGDKWGGGGGAGGSILLRAQNISVGSNLVQATGGAPRNGGGRGGAGRIRIEYCESFSGSTSPPASTQKLNCYIAEQVESAPYTTTRLNLPESFANGRTYQVQYGRRLVFGGAGEQTTTLRVPAGAFNGAALDALLSEVGSGSLTFRLDVGNDSSWDWEWSGNVNGATALNSPGLHAAFSRYWASHGAPLTGTVDVPVKVSLSKAGQVLLTNLQVTPTGSRVRFLRLPARPYSSVTAQFTVNNGDANPGPLTVAADVGDNGTVDWTWSGAPTYPATLTTGNLAGAVNAYLSGRTGEVDVPIRFYVAPFLPLGLNNFTATPADRPDATLTAGDIVFGASSPTEGDVVSVTATVHNTGVLDSGPLAASFFATAPGWGEWYLGSAFVPNVSAGGTAQATIPWNTLGFTGTVPVRVVVDPYNRVAEISETNNVATATLTIRTRPDLQVTEIALSDDEPTAGETVTVTLTLRNAGQATAGAQTVTLYQGSPDAGGIVVGADGRPPLPGGMETAIAFPWTPTAPGPYRLFARADRDGQINEYDEGNNDAWRDVYVGFAGPILLDSGGNPDPAYTPILGYGYLNESTRVVSCGTGPEATLRAANSDTLYYRFDHLLPGHFYHLDITLRDCNGTRAEEVYVDDTLVASAVDLSDHQPHRISIRLDPALYADHTVVVGIHEIHGLDAMVAEISLHDVDYRYADAGGANDPVYPASGAKRPYGWLDGEPLTTWGSLPYQTVRMDRADTDPGDDPDNELRYRFDNLRPDRRYRLHLTFRQMTGATVVQKVQIDGTDASPSFNLDHNRTYTVTLSVPPEAYATDGSIIIGIVRVDCVTSEAFVNEIALEEETLPAGNPCSGVTATPARTIAYGNVTIGGHPAPVGTVIQTVNPRDQVVGCAVVQQTGQYPYLQIYGEDPPIPGMRPGEIVEFRVNGIPAVAEPSLYWQDDKTPHQINLSIGSTEGQCIWLQPNWNLTSFRLRPPVPPVEDVLRSIDGRYCRVLGETGVYDCEIAPIYRTLAELEPGLGYYVRLTTTMGANLRVEGLTVPVTTPLPLHTYWNWVGYLPPTTLPISQALQSIAGHYLLVHSLDATYNPADPVHSTLWEMEPGKGYLIRATESVTLVYPAISGTMQMQALPPENALLRTRATICDGVSPTPDFIVVYGNLTVNGEPAPAGTRVEIVTPRGEVAGCFVVQHPGEYGYVHVYGEDPSDPPIPGFREGEPLAFRVNGVPAIPSETLFWQNDLTLHRVNLSATIRYLYLPLVFRSQ